MTEYAEIVGTLFVSGFIGYITNATAIKMLFRPHEEKNLFGWHIPFTPGSVPKEKNHIAEVIGNVISKNFMNPEYLNRYLLSEKMIKKIRTSVSDFAEKLNTNEETTKEKMKSNLSFPQQTMRV